MRQWFAENKWFLVMLILTLFIALPCSYQVVKWGREWRAGKITEELFLLRTIMLMVFFSYFVQPFRRK